MKIFVCCSKAFYPRVAPIKHQLEAMRHTVTLPNSYDNPGREAEMQILGWREHARWKAEMLRLQKAKVKACDAVLVLNFEKNGQPRYIGGATFLEMYMAFDFGKKLFLYNDVPDGMLRDEIIAFEPTVIYGDLLLITT